MSSPVTLVLYDEEVNVPDWVHNLESFRRWAHSDEFPPYGRICFLEERVWIDMSKEQIFTHVGLKSEFAGVLGPLAKRKKIGRFFTDGVLLSNADTSFSCVPDGVFASYASFDTLVRLIEGADTGYVELEGSPDMTLEIVSNSSFKKDTKTLRAAYWAAGVREYWLVHGRSDPLQFDILRHTARGYVAKQKTDGWIKSQVFGHSFRLTQGLDLRGNPDFTLEVR